MAHMDDLRMICKGAIPERRVVRKGKNRIDGALQLVAERPWRSGDGNVAAEDLWWLCDFLLERRSADRLQQVEEMETRDE